MKKIFQDFNVLIDKIRNNYLKKELEQIQSVFVLQANIMFSDLKKNNSFVIYISKSSQKGYKGFSPSAGLSFIGPSTIWEKILAKEMSLITALVEGKIKIPNLRINWNKLMRFSFLISCLR